VPGSGFLEQQSAWVADARKAVQLAPGSADAAELDQLRSCAFGIPRRSRHAERKGDSTQPELSGGVSGHSRQRLSSFAANRASNCGIQGLSCPEPRLWLTDIVIAITGQTQEAMRAAEQLLPARPNFTMVAWLKTQFIRRDTARVEADTDALRAAGLPTG
jgi:hypothetical protein